MGAIRTLYTDLKLRSADALKGLVAYGRQWQTVEKVVASAAASIEKNADRAAAAMARMSTGAAQMRAAGSGAGGGAARGGSSPRATTRADNAMARQTGLADGAKAIREATAALGPLATKSDRAKAAVADLAAQVARNRKEMADLRAEAVRTGDAEGTLKARMQGLATATGQASVALAGARGELRKVDGGLIDAIKHAANLRERFGALQVAAGNLIAGGVSTAFRGIVGAISDSTDKAIKFETELTSISKVSRGADDTAAGFARITEGIKTASKELGVMPTEVAALTAQLAPAFSDVSEGVDGVKVDLVALTSDVTKIGVAWDITGKEAGKTFAEISSGLQLTTAETKSLFGGINELGNQLGTKASTVAEAVQRSAGVLKGANISGETGAALNAVLIKTGSSAEVAATGVRTFVARLGAGEAATKKQLSAFKELGLSAKDVARELTSGDAVRAEAQIKKVVEAIGGLDDDKKLPVLIEMFGSESIGSIGAAATATDLLGKSFAIMGDKAASATSVQKEFDRVSQTSAVKMAKLKANVEVLAISFGEALLPHINKVVEFLTSPEGQEWGRGAVEKAVSAVTTLASVVGTLVGVFTSVTDVIGGTDLAVGALALRIGALAGPWGIAAAAAVVAGATMIKVLGDVVRDAGVMDGVFSGLFDTITDKQNKVWNDKIRDADIDKDLNKPAARAYGYGPAPMGSAPPPTPKQELAMASNDRARFDALSAKVRKGEALRPSEAKEYSSLSKSLDEAKARKAGKGKAHKATKMDRQLAAIGGDVRGVLTSGGERDSGGDLMVHNDVLSRSVLARSPGGGGLGSDRSDGAGIGPGPSVENKYDNRNYTVNMEIDARGRESSADNIRSAANQVSSRLQVEFTGGARVKAERNAGGVLRGPG